ncbi:MAG: lipoyl(octanoyl) transferase LipB [Deltaproteobacteria bacterium]|nr:lipoyl(octanoyl) transferase LipB [Deltaproteobacteria bacterium]
MRTLLFRDLGQIDYLSALSLQERLVEIKQREGLPDILLLVEHPHVFTIGRGGKDSNLLCPGEVPVYRASRGGDATYHGPGQMVVYPLLDLRSRLRKDVHRYLRLLEMVLIRTLNGFGLDAERNPPWTGVWIEKRKIASIGVAVRKGITYHGLALNVSTDLTYFNRIIPCGLAWAEMTSIQKEVGREVPLEQVKEEFLRHFLQKFHYAELIELCCEDIQIGSRSGLQAAPTTSASSGF